MNGHVGEAELDAFADGEVEPSRQRILYEHVRECDACRAQLEAVSAMKASLTRHWSRQTATLELRERLLGAVQGIASRSVGDGRAAAGPSPEVQPSGEARRDVGDLKRGRRSTRAAWLGRAMVVTGLAAAVTLVLVSWRPTGAPATPEKLVVEVPDRAVIGLREAHTAWEVVQNDSAPAALLASSPTAVAEQLGQALELKVLAPDFSAAGFTLVGGNLCEVSGLPAAQIRYLRDRPTPTRLSFFTTLRNERMSSQVGDVEGGREFFVSSSDALVAGTEATVVAWHSGPQTYSVCARLPRDELMRLVRGSKIAVTIGEFEEYRESLLAFAQHAPGVPADEWTRKAPASRPREDSTDVQPASGGASRRAGLVKAGLAFWALSQVH